MEKSFEDSINQFLSILSADSDPEQIEAPQLPEDSNSEVRREAFKRALYALSKPDSEASLSEEAIDSFISFFAVLYGTGDGYRHMYSDVCSVMYSYLKTGKELDRGELPPQSLALSVNMDIIAKQIANEERPRVVQEKERERFCDAVKAVGKLHDHIELERTRLEYLVQQNERLENTSDDAERAAQEARDATKAAEEKAEEAKTKFRDIVDDSKREYITILGIFAAIVITFTAGSAFSASVLQNIASASIYRIAFMCLVIGFFLFNVIAVLLLFLREVSKLGDDTVLSKIVKWVDLGFVVLIVLVVLARLLNVMARFPVV